ncbi:DUF3572 family protein [Rhodobacterales bacterium HKCCE3408]|nr:DUF3572 family protein [Rhodobacterales bacterium HKCCE3408]
MIKKDFPDRSHSSVSPDRAEAIALQALGWLVADEELLPVFLGATGADGSELRARAGDPVFLASVIDFLMMDDRWILSCADACGIPPETFAAARAALPGGDLPNWT